jgi:hypothetical protein
MEQRLKDTIDGTRKDLIDSGLRLKVQDIETGEILEARIELRYMPLKIRVEDPSEPPKDFNQLLADGEFTGKEVSCKDKQGNVRKVRVV